MNHLKLKFHQEMIDIYKTAKKECGYNAVRFLQMVVDRGGVDAAKQLIGKPTSGFGTLIEFRRPDLTVEALVLKPEYRSLFTEEELLLCKDRLRDYGFGDCK